MNKPKLFYSALLIVTAILLTFIGYSIVHQTTSNPEALTTTTKQDLVKLEKYSIIQLKIFNREGRGINYTICTSLNNSNPRCFSQPIGNEKTFTYQYYAYPKEDRKKEVTILIYKEGEPEPIENITYYVPVENFT